MRLARSGYLPSTALTADHQGLVGWLQVTTNIPVGFLSHHEDVRLELLLKDEQAIGRIPGDSWGK